MKPKILKENSSKFILFFILLIGFLLRFYQLGLVPASLDWDEVSWGYNAYSILQTGRDEYGKFLPLSFKAFGDYKQPLYVYADTLPVAFFGLTPFAVRFPSALAGFLSIIFVYLLVLELFAHHKKKKTLALLTALFFAISPWSVQFSRVAFEANVGLFFVLIGFWLFLKGINTNLTRFLFASIPFFALSTYTYHSEKLFTPLLLAGLVLLNWRYFWQKKRVLFGLFFFFVLLSSFWLLDSRTTARGRNVLFTQNSSQILEIPVKEALYDKTHHDFLGSLTHNRRVVYTLKYISNYLSHFDPNWLFIKGDNNRHHAPGMGILYLVDLPFILLGIWFLLHEKKAAGVVFLWFFLAPVASSLATDAPNASRSMVFLPTWQIFTAVGVLNAFSYLQQTRFKKVFLLILFSFFTLNFYYYTHQYFVHTNTLFQKDWQYGYKEAVSFAAKYQNKNQKIIFDHNFEQPYIFYLFYTKYNPVKYIKEGGSERIWQQCFSIDSTYFGSCERHLKTGTIYITTHPETATNMKEIKRIFFTNGEPAVIFYEYLKE